MTWSDTTLGGGGTPVFPVPAQGARMVIDHDFRGGSFGHFRDHVQNDPDAYIGRPPIYLVDWPADSDYALGMSTYPDADAHAAQNKKPNTAGTYWNTSRTAVEGQRYVYVFLKFATRAFDESKKFGFVMGVDTQAWDGSWRGFNRLTCNYAAAPYSWGVQKNDGTQYRGGGLGSAPFVGPNEGKSNTDWVGFRIDQLGAAGKGTIDRVFIAGQTYDTSGIGADEYGQQVPQIASSFNGGWNLAVYLTNGDAANLQPLEAILTHVKVWTENR